MTGHNSSVSGHAVSHAVTGHVTRHVTDPATDAEVLAALQTLQTTGLVADRDRLNKAWRELTGRASPDLCGRCGQPGAYPYSEPRGVWHHWCLPSLWRTGGNPMTAPACRTCGAPGGVPNHPSGRPEKATCRDHAPAWLKSYLHQPDTEEATA